jgi:excinuclease ABC subunit A
VIAEADWILDMGPEAGRDGGHVVVAGTPAQIAAKRGSHTGAVLGKYIGERHGA